MTRPLSCPAEEDLLLHVLSGEHRSGDAVVRHLSQCPFCDARVAELRGAVLAVGASAGSARTGPGECLDELALAELLDHGGDPEVRAARVAHVSRCGHCRGELASLVTLLREPGVAAEMRRLEGTGAGRRAVVRRLATTGLIAAAVLLAVQVVPRRAGERQRGGVPHRAPVITATAAPAPVSPIGDVADAPELRWAAVSGADRYRVTLFDATGRVRYEREVADTVAALPDSLGLVAGRSYLWKVEASTGWQRWASSELIEFRLTRAPSR